MWKNLDECSLFRDLQEAKIPDITQRLKGEADACRYALQLCCKAG